MRLVAVLAMLAACKGDEGTTDKDGGGEDCVAEVPYDGEDQDCDGSDLVDVDEDGYDAASVGGSDCNDEDAAIHPTAAEIPYDDIDQDCADGDLLDADGDGDLPLSEGGGDCDDTDELVHAGAADTVGNGVDNDCDGIDGVDADADGFASVDSGGVDCDDDNVTVNPGAEEIWYDGADQNCDRRCDWDQDGDGAVGEAPPQIPNNSPCDAAPGPEAWAPEDCDDSDPQVSDVVVGRTSPEDGAQGVPTLLTVFVTLTGNDPTATLRVFDLGTQLEVPGALVAGGANLEWSPNDPLAGGTEFRVDVELGCGTESLRFTTEYPVVPVNPDDLVGKAWSVDLSRGLWISPEIAEELLYPLLESRLTLEVVGTGPDALDLRLGTVDAAGAQDLCLPTGLATADFANNPELVAGPADWPFLDGFALTGATLTGGVRGGGDFLADATLTSSFNTGPLSEIILGGAPEDLCAVLIALGESCVECADGSGPLCLDLHIEELQGVSLATPIVPRTQEEIDLDPACP